MPRYAPAASTPSRLPDASWVAEFAVLVRVTTRPNASEVNAVVVDPAVCEAIVPAAV
ncbi:MAG TPA: hypothetical protein VJT31_15805 [Rugosimonospora sp.]|nr:hypothetical protein [Rugosimonospora sp.]